MGENSNNILRDIPEAPEDAIFGISAAYKADTSPDKVNLGVGAYRNDAGEPVVLKVVREAEIRLVHDESLRKEYLPIDGLPQFRTLSAQLLLGKDSAPLREGRVAIAQALSGTGALRVGMELIRRFFPEGTRVVSSNPTWGNHKAIVERSGLAYSTYRYYDPATRGLNLGGMLEDLHALPAGTVVILHAVAHNPTGVDPSREGWDQILAVVRERQLVAFLDCAYQGFGSGCLEKDAYAIRLFAESGVPTLVAQSYSKNMGLYSERVGTITVVCPTAASAAAVQSQLKKVIRPMYSNPPRNGAYIVATILGDPQLLTGWRDELAAMAERVLAMRKALYDHLQKLGTPGSWEHILNQAGMFTFTGLSPAQVESVTKNFHIYLLKSGRINMCGLNSSNIAYVAKAFDDAVRKIPASM